MSFDDNSIKILAKSLMKTCTESLFNTKLSSNFETLKNHLNCLKDYSLATIEIFNILNSSQNILDISLCELLNKPEFAEFLIVSNVHKLKKQIIAKFNKKLQEFFNCASIILSFTVYLGIKVDDINIFIAEAKEIKEKIIKCSAQETKIDATFPNISINKVIPSLINKTRKSASSRRISTENTLEKMKFENHTCVVCKQYPAAYFLRPCNHSAFCHYCMDKLEKTNTVFEHCYYCQTLVQKIECLHFLQNP